MTPGLLLRPRLISALNTAIAGTLEPEFARILLAKPPFATTPEISITAHSGRPLHETGYSSRKQPYFFLNEWRRQRLHSIRFPYLVCLLEGEMDWRIGVTESMAKTLSEPDASCSHFTLSLSEGQFLLIPPGVPYSDGKRLHWYRPHPENAHYKVLWMHFLPTGTFCHLSRVVQGERLHGAPLYIHDPRVYLLSELLLEELQTHGADFEAVARNHLHSILLRVRRQLQAQPLFPITGGNQEWRHESAQQDLQEILAESTTSTVQRACSYIEAHLSESLPTENVAQQAFVSPSHLNRLFRRELGTSVMRYTTRRRIEIAQALLTHSQLPVQEIGRQVGYPNPSHFSQIFTRETRQSPQNFRRKRQASTNESES